jgi:predicted Zn finger-like uncharacterized protein
MIIICPSCSARYPVEAVSFAPSGRKVRCAKCGNTWHQAPPSDLGRVVGEAEVDASDVAAPVPPEFRSSSGSQKPLFNSGVGGGQKNKPVESERAPEVADVSVKATSADPVDDDDIQFAPEETSVSEGMTEPDRPVRFYDTTTFQKETGGTLRRYLKDVASMRRGRVFGAIGWALLVLFVAGSIYGIVQYRRDIAMFWPSTAKFYAAAGAPINLVGFELSQVSYERQEENGLPVLAVKGVVVNVSGEIKQVPRLRVSLRDDKQVELYHWTFAVSEAELKPDQKVNFVTRLSSPPVGARDLEVRFAEPGDEPKSASVSPNELADAPSKSPDNALSDIHQE